jgi:hypothetical protein
VTSQADGNRLHVQLSPWSVTHESLRYQGPEQRPRMLLELRAGPDAVGVCAVSSPRYTRPGPVQGVGPTAMTGVYASGRTAPGCAGRVGPAKSGFGSVTPDPGDVAPRGFVEARSPDANRFA